MMFDLAVGGSWGGPPDNSTVFPQKMLVDWIRVYKKSGTTEIEQCDEKRYFKKNPVTVTGKWINLDLKNGASIKFSVHDMAGREIARVDDFSNASQVHVPVPAGLSRGCYVWKLVANGKANSGKFAVD